MFDRGIERKTPEQIAVMRRAGLVVADMLAATRAAVMPGVTTAEIDAVARSVLERHGATSNFLGYGAHGPSGEGGFPGVVCTSVNDEVVHTIPGERVLRDGDIVSIDCGAVVDGWHGDAATTVAVGRIDESRAELLRVTEEALWRGIAAASLGGRVGDISHAIEQYVRSQGEFGIVRGFTGHGIGSAMHQSPDVPNHGRAHRGPRLVRGLVLAVEPMITLGSAHTRTLADDWTVVTVDGSAAAHFEHTFTLTDDGAWVLTAEDGGRARLEALPAP